MILREEWLKEQYKKEKEEYDKKKEKYLEELKKEVSQMDRKDLEEKLVKMMYYMLHFLRLK